MCHCYEGPACSGASVGSRNPICTTWKAGDTTRVLGCEIGLIVVTLHESQRLQPLGYPYKGLVGRSAPLINLMACAELRHWYGQGLFQQATHHRCHRYRAASESAFTFIKTAADSVSGVLCNELNRAFSSLQISMRFDKAPPTNWAAFFCARWRLFLWVSRSSCCPARCDIKYQGCCDFLQSHSHYTQHFVVCLQFFNKT